MKNIDIPYGFFATTPRSLSRGSESPSSLTAVTRNLYSLPGFRPVTSNSVIGEFPGILPTLTHFPVFVSIFSISYSLIGTPPSSSGFSHFTLAVVLVTSLTSRGPLGALGFPATRDLVLELRLFSNITHSLVILFYFIFFRNRVTNIKTR